MGRVFHRAGCGFGFDADHLGRSGGRFSTGAGMNLSQTNGKVPIWVGGETPWLLIDWPDRETFEGLWGVRTPQANIQNYWDMLVLRKDGAKLREVGAKFSITRERVRAIEARFLRLMKEHYLAQTSKTAKPESSHVPARNR